jgi:predicted porin
MLLGKVNTLLIVIVFSSLPLMAESNVTSPSSLDPDVPKFYITYQGDALVCSPTELIKKKTHKDLVKYECKKKDIDQTIEKKQDEERGHAETQRLNEDVKNKIAQGPTYSVEIPLYDADSPTRAKIIAQQQLNNRPHGKYIRMILPAKLYISIRPQLVNSGEDGEIKLQDGGSRGGFFYYYQFNNDLELIFQYEAGIDWDEDTPFLNASDASNTNRRLSYFAFKYMDNSLILGKYWSAYYDIAGFTDQFMTYGAQASGAFSASASGTGRADKLIQFRSEQDTYDTTLEVQLKHDALRDWNTDYSYTMAGSMIYKGWENIKLGAAINYGKFDHVTPEMKNDGIDGDDLSSIIGVTYKKNRFSTNAVLSYMKNHTLDDQGVYFDSVGAELYMRYDIDESFRVAGGGNWLFPEDDDYDGKYNIKNIILSLQYTFGEKTFDDMVYMEVSLPNGKFANGDSKDARIAIGLRYLLDF